MKGIGTWGPIGPNYEKGEQIDAILEELKLLNPVIGDEYKAMRITFKGEYSPDSMRDNLLKIKEKGIIAARYCQKTDKLLVFCKEENVKSLSSLEQVKAVRNVYIPSLDFLAETGDKLEGIKEQQGKLN